MGRVPGAAVAMGLEEMGWVAAEKVTAMAGAGVKGWAAAGPVG